MKKLYIWICLLGGLVLGACVDESCRVDGWMSDLPGEVNVSMLRRTGEFSYDTVLTTVMKDGKFHLEVPKEMCGELYTLQFPGKRSHLDFFAEQGVVLIKGNGKTIYDAEVKGTPENDKWDAYQNFLRQNTRQRNELRMELSRSDEPDSVKRMKSMRLFQKLDAEIARYKDSLTRSDNHSVVGLYFSYMRLPMLKYDQIDEILLRFTPQLAGNRYYKEMKARADILRRISPGVVAPDFEVKTPDGGSVKLSSFRGKYLILDFWASWCAPCREESVHIKDIYNKFHDVGLDVFSVSLDHEKEAWLKAIEEDGMNWNHGSQLVKGGKHTPVAKLYGIDGIPAIWVIDPDGKILAEGLNGESLIEFCKELFQNK